MMKNITYENICKQIGCLDREKRFFTSMDLQFDTTFDVKMRNFSSSLFAIVFCEKGTMRLSVDFKEFTLEPNKALIIRPNMTISIVNCWGFMARAIFFNPSKKNEIAISSRYLTDLYLSTFRNPVKRLNDSASALFRKIITTILTISHKTCFTEIESQYWDTAIMFLLYGCVLSDIKDNRVESSPNRYDEIFIRFLILCENNYKTQRQVSWYAEKLCITPKYLSSIVRKCSKKTTHSWINEMVIREICFQLRFSDYSIQQIAYNLNFTNQSFFGKYFKNHIGYTPSEYRLINKV